MAFHLPFDTWAEVVKQTRMEPDAIRISHEVIVKRKKQKEVAEEFEVTPQRVSEIVARTKKEFLQGQHVPEDWEVFTLSAPKEVGEVFKRILDFLMRNKGVQNFEQEFEVRRGKGKVGKVTLRCETTVELPEDLLEFERRSKTRETSVS